MMTPNPNAQPGPFAEAVAEAHSAEEKAVLQAAHDYVSRLIQSVTKGRASTIAALSGAERRRVRRAMDRRMKRAAGVYPVGAVSSALCHRIGGGK